MYRLQHCKDISSMKNIRHLKYSPSGHLVAAANSREIVLIDAYTWKVSAILKVRTTAIKLLHSRAEITNQRVRYLSFISIFGLTVLIGSYWSCYNARVVLRLYVCGISRCRWCYICLVLGWWASLPGICHQGVYSYLSPLRPGTDMHYLMWAYAAHTSDRYRQESWTVLWEGI